MNTNLALYKDLHVYFYVMYTFMFCCVVGILERVLEQVLHFTQ